MSEGHPDAWNYTIGLIYQEANLVIARRNRDLADRTEMMVAAISAIPNQAVKPKSTTDARKQLQKRLKLMKGL